MNSSDFDCDSNLNNEKYHNIKNEEIQTCGNILKNYYSIRKSNSIYDKLSERKLKEENIAFYEGPIDLMFVFCIDINIILEKIQVFLGIKKISNVKLSKYKYLCSFEGNNFDVNIFRLEVEGFYYIKNIQNKNNKKIDKNRMNVNSKNLNKNSQSFSLDFRKFNSEFVNFINNWVGDIY